MTLEEKIIARLGDVKALYTKSPDKSVKPLIELGFLPLTVKSLCTEPGQALLHFASWVYFSGGLHPTKFRPYISQSLDLLEMLENEKLAALEQEYKFSNQPNRVCLELKTNSGLFGRLLYAMGVPLPKGTNRSRKPDYSKGLPHFINDIMDSNPIRDEIKERKNLLTIVASVLFKDRFEKQSDEWGKDHYSLRLNHHQTEAQAEAYGKYIIDFLNCFFEKGNSQSVFGYASISIGKKIKHNKNLFFCSLRFSDEDLGYLITKAPHLLKPIQTDY